MESAEACSTRLSGYLHQLAEANPLFADWRQTGWSKKEANRRKLDTSQLELRKLLLHDARGRIPELGFMFGLWAENSEGDSCKLQGSCGIATQVGWNSVSLRLPFNTPTSPKFLEMNFLKRLVEHAVSAWEPAWVEVSTDEIVALNVPADPMHSERLPRIGWLTWLPSALHLLPQLPEQVSAEQSVASGTLITIVGQAFETGSSKHMQLVKETRDKLLCDGILVRQP